MQGELLSLGRSLVGRCTYSQCLPNAIILDSFIIAEVMKPASVCLVCVMLGWAVLGCLLLKKKENRVQGASIPELRWCRLTRGIALGTQEKIPVGLEMVEA